MDFVLLINEYSSLINLVIAVFALVAIIIAIRSFCETQKTRRDMFLPAVISSNDRSTKFSLDDKGSIYFYIINAGHGIALRPRVYLTGIKRRDAIEAEFFDYETQSTVLKEFIDHRQAQGVCYYRFDSTDLTTEDLQRIFVTKIGLEILYEDIFKRHIKTTYNMTLKHEKDGTYQFYMDNCKIHLP